MVKKGTKAIRSALLPAQAAARQDEDQLFEARDSMAPDPDDPRLSPGAAVVGEDGKLDVGAYEDLQSAFAGEPPPAKHPMPDRPGVRAGEDVPKGLRMWDDLKSGNKGGKDGAGWIAQSTKKGEKKREKWFNIRTCGSWRLAFLLARLQRELWERGGAASAARAAEQPSDDGKLGTPPRKRAAPAAKSTARKAARRGAEAPEGQAAKAAAAPPSNPFAGSARFAAIMAAKKAAEEAAAAGDKPSETV